jgi:SET domain-containing protein
MPVPPMSYLSPKTAVQDSPIHGRGLFAREPIRRGEIVCVKGGSIFNGSVRRSLQPLLGAAEIPIADDLFIGPRSPEEREGAMIFSNHSCDPNIGVQGQIVFVALRDIAAGEELTHDWATTDDDDYEMVCRCGAANCRQIVTGQDWRQPALQAKYRHCMSWYLQEKIRRQAQQEGA